MLLAPEEPLLIPAIVEATRLPPEYLSTYLTSPVGNTRCARIRKSGRFWSSDRTSEQPIDQHIDIPDCIIEELQTMPYTHLLGQGVLIRGGANTHTSFITIAEAACAQLSGLEDLLECVLIAISQAVNKKLYDVEWTLSWKVDPLKPPEDHVIKRHRAPNPDMANVDAKSMLSGYDLNMSPITTATPSRFSYGLPRIIARGSSWGGIIGAKLPERHSVPATIKKREAVKRVAPSYDESGSHKTEVLPSNSPGLMGLTTISTSTNPSSHSAVKTSPTGQRPYMGATSKQKSSFMIPVGLERFPNRGDLRNEKVRRWQDEEALVESRGGLRQDRAIGEIYRNTTIVEDEPTEAERNLPSVSVKQDSVCWSPLAVSNNYRCSTVVTTLDTIGSTKLADIRTVLQWLEIIIGRPPAEGLLQPGKWLTALERDDWSLSLIDLEDEVTSSQNSCWRRKILRGRGTKSIWVPTKRSWTRLTAACLWSLFDNSLRRVPCCRCTFISGGGDYLQCKQKSGQWLVWHVLDATEKICDGLECQNNVSVFFAATEGGEWLMMTTPCVLDWTAEIRDYAARPIAKCVNISSEMGKRIVAKRQVDSLQAQFSLSAAFPIAPQILGGVTFSKKRYKIANSIDHDSNVAMNIAVAAVVLVFCEKSGIHLIMDGAELLETLCVSLLDQMDCRDYPSCFASGTAKARVQSWRNSTFLTPYLSVVAGSDLVRQASKLVTSLLESTKNISRDNNGKPVYWTLESLLQQSQEEPLLPPKHNTHVSWHTLASKAPPLILAVGEIDPRLVTGSDEHLSWLEQCAPLNTTRKDFEFEWFGKSSKPRGRRGLVTNQPLFERWVRHATRNSFRGQLVITTDMVMHDKIRSCVDCTFRILGEEDHERTNLGENLSFGCTACSQTSDRQCLHYVQ
ncbi:hypothetical protein MMC17_009016 [Xylographa soralifera]|nr:hypothetical protein [Xylographa soralifera]